MRILKMSALMLLSLAAVFVLGAILFANEASVRAESAPLSAGAQADAQADAQASGCRTPEHRAFDFWVGLWVVYDPQGKVVGHSTIELVLDGCALHETWESTGGSSGNSYSFYDATADKWHQTWIDATGSPLYLDGAWTGEAMVLGDGTNRITWTPTTDGGVRQHWETTTDGGATWATAFDGLYVPARQE